MQRKTKTVLTKKAKILMFLLVTSLIYPMITAFTDANIGSYTEEKSENYIFVKAGDTLWDIARDNNPKQKNVRKRLDEIMAYNNLADAEVFPGEKILLP